MKHVKAQLTKQAPTGNTRPSWASTNADGHIRVRCNSGSFFAAETGVMLLLPGQKGGGIMCRLRAHAWVSTGLPSAEAEAVLGLLGFWGGEPWLPG